MTDQTPPQTKQLPPLLNPDKEHQMIFNEGIGVIENYGSKEWCKILIDAFEMYNNQRLQKNILDGSFSQPASNEGKSQFINGQLGRKDEQLFLEVADSTLAAHTNAIIGSAFELYAQEYQGITDSSDPVSSWTCKLQKTQSGGGYHIWHCEDGAFVYRDRVLTWMMYLNDIPVENGGATDFLHQKCSFQPTTGTMVMWPATYTHMHRGSFLTGDIPKYIATGWFLREPGNVTNRIIGEGLGNVSSHHVINK
jgi:hypothetical protein